VHGGVIWSNSEQVNLIAPGKTSQIDFCPGGFTSASLNPGRWAFSGTWHKFREFEREGGEYGWFDSGHCCHSFGSPEEEGALAIFQTGCLCASVRFLVLSAAPVVDALRCF
jgi:hypothetical protein